MADARQPCQAASAGHLQQTMNEQKPIIAVGEALIELTRGKDGRFSLSSGGDAFNTAIYLARAGLKVAFATALGDDPYSDGLVALATAERIESDLMLRIPQRLAGLALIDPSVVGERHLFAWRD